MDINCDLGEGIANELDVMPLVDSCNIACGGHYGDTASMTATLALAKKFRVKVGAHPSYNDRTNFGRKIVQLPPDKLKHQLIAQISELDTLATSMGIALHHVKAHGALYNQAAREMDIGNALIDSVVSFEQDLCIFVPYGSNLHALAIKRGVKHWVEVFADRKYTKNLELVSRDKENALISEPLEVKNSVRMMINEQNIQLENGQKLPIQFDTICVHGDHPKAFEILKSLRALKTEEY